MINKKQPSGFTLVELLVSLTIFMTASLIIIDTFVLSNRAQRKGTALQKVQSDGRLILNTLADQVRSASVDYAYYGGGGVVDPVETLALRDSDNKQLLFRKDAVTCQTAASSPCLQISHDNVTWDNISSGNIKLQYVKFYITPTLDPFGAGGNPPNLQPAVTAVIGLSSSSAATGEDAPIFLQSTTSSRVYKR